MPIGNYKSSDLFLMTALLLGGFLAVGTVNAAESDRTAKRESFTEQGQRNAGGSAISGIELQDAMQKDGPRLSASSSSKSGSRVASSDPNFWIYDAATLLFHDYDNDGYYTRLELEFDADTNFVSADVYARLFLSLDGGPWNEYTTTAIFTIHGSSGTDDYFVDTDLVSGYPAGSYDLLIELYDAYDGQFVTSFGPAESSELFDLPLEDQKADSVIISSPVSHSHGGGGATGWLAALFLAALLLIRVSRRRMM